jgi:hypothetical protein
VEDRRQLEADDAAAHHQQPPRNLGQLEGVCGIHDARVVAGQARKLDGPRAGRDDGVLELDGRRSAFALDRESVRAVETPGPPHHLHLAALREVGEARRQLADDLLLEGAQLAEVDPRLAEIDAMGGRRLHFGHEGREVEQRLGGNAADVEAHAAQRGVALDQHDPLAQVCGAEGRRVAARPGSQDQHLSAGRFGRHRIRFRMSDRTVLRRVVKRAASAPSITRWS